MDSVINPANRFNSVELAIIEGAGFSYDGKGYFTVDGMNVINTGSNAFGGGGAHDGTIKNNSCSYIGGYDLWTLVPALQALLQPHQEV